MPVTSLVQTHLRGPLLIIGGAEEREDPAKATLLQHVVKRARGKKARLLVCAAATEQPEQALATYHDVFHALGVADVMGFPMDSREAVDTPEVMDALDRATGVFFTGGDQLRLTGTVAGTSFGARLSKRFHEGLFVAGTSAGAAAVAGTMVIGGGGTSVCRACVDLAPGLGFWPETIVDTHFDRSGRVHRLMAAIVQNPGVLGIGLDEDTGVEVTPEGEMTVLGRGNVFVFDGRIRHSNVADVAEDEPVAMTYSTLHVLAAGYGMNLRSMEPVLPQAATAGRA